VHLLSFNVNSLNVRAGCSGFLPWLAAAAPDLLLLQETKAVDAGAVRKSLLPAVPAWRLPAGACASRAADASRGRLNHGVATLVPRDGARLPVLLAQADLPLQMTPARVEGAPAGEDWATRLVTTWVGEPLRAVIVNVYQPNTGSGFSKSKRRESWDAAFLLFCRLLLADGGAALTWPAAGASLFAAAASSSAAPAPAAAVAALDFSRYAGRLIVMGDLNVCADLQLDVTPSPAAGAALWLAGTSDAERQAFLTLLREGLHDVWRERNAGQRAASWFNPSTLGGRGTHAARFDAALVSTALLPLVADARIWDDQAPSGDHFPISLYLALPSPGGEGAIAF